MALYVLANFGERNATARIVSLIATATVAGLALLYPIFFQTTVAAGIAMVVSAILGLIYLVPPVQRATARVIPVRPGSPVVYLTVVLGLLLVAQQVGTQLTKLPPLTYTDLLAQDIPFLILAFVGVGVFVRRSPREAIERLGLKRPRAPWWWLVSLAGVGIFLAVGRVIDLIASVVAPDQVQQLNNVSTVLFSNFHNPAAAIFLGLLAGIVEEILFRGAIVPRLGVVVASILFAALHTEYAVSFATLEVFVLSLGLGWLRVYSGSTLTCIVTHVGYDIAVGLLPFVVA